MNAYQISISSYSAHSICKTGDGLSKSYMYTMFQQATSQSWNLAVPRHTLLGWSSKPSYAMIQHCLYSSLLNIWSTARFSGLQGAALCRPAPPILSRARPRGNFFLLSPWKHVKRKPYSWSCYTRLLTAQEIFQPIPGLGCNCISNSTLVQGEWWVEAVCTLLQGELLMWTMTLVMQS